MPPTVTTDPRLPSIPATLSGWPSGAVLDALVAIEDGAVVIVNADGVIVQAAGACQAVFAQSPAALIGRRFDDPAWGILDLEGQPLAGERLPYAVLRREGRPLRNLRHGVTWPDGAQRVYAVSGHLLPPGEDGMEGAALMLVRDVTTQQRGEAMVASAQRAKRRFLGALSHELRTPLNAVIGFSDLLLSTAADRLTERERGSLADVLAAGLRLLGSVNAMLDLAAVESGRFALSVAPLCLPTLLAEVVEAASPEAMRRSIGLRLLSLPASGLPDAVAVFADRGRLRQVLEHLLHNAIRHGGPPGPVEVMTMAGSQPGLVRVAVRDHGPGIPAHLWAEVFEPFATLQATEPDVRREPDSAASPGAGLGIGLAVCRHLVEAMNGRIGVDSTPGGGSLFWLELPRAEPSAVNTALW